MDERTETPQCDNDGMSDLQCRLPKDHDGLHSDGDSEWTDVVRIPILPAL
jgi:hypothetical protein